VSEVSSCESRFSYHFSLDLQMQQTYTSLQRNIMLRKGRIENGNQESCKEEGRPKEGSQEDREKEVSGLR